MNKRSIPRWCRTVLAAWACTGATWAYASQAPLQFEPCRIDDIPGAVQCAKLDVPLAVGDHRQVSVQIVRLPALTRQPAPDPVLLLAGGPGQAASALGRLAQALGAVRRERDLLLVDQRGTGRSQPLDCKLPADADPLSDLLKDKLLPDEVLSCFASLREQAAHYTTHDYIRDLEAVRARLGIEQFNLWGGSYGTRVVQEYLRLHPERVRTAVMDGVVSSTTRLTADIAANNDARLHAVVVACQQSSSCHAAYPKLQQIVEQLPRQLQQKPIAVDLPHPLTGVQLKGQFSDISLASTLGVMLYQPEMQALVPRLLYQVSQGEVRPLLAAYSQVMLVLGEQMNDVLYFAVACAEDAEVPTLPAAGVFVSVQKMAREVCAAWGLPGKPLPGPVKSNVPTLLLSGGLDPVTPPRLANQVATGLANRLHLQAPQLGHVISHYRCVPKVIHEFIQDAKAGAEAKSCDLKLRAMPALPFYVTDKEARP
ncbi:pimeloyl-ACP methyl ester carboxylesterase [Chitinivorax tropicus]|uniref:Pimeloyl-ACP methyl ester carboxylesterase n=1 Tax=Chitinivorax tropicus TaxID=714531 RepID=A0A840MLK2_9PROT|nr:alpha/beta fold hydrolase [Chitinivorax tropicus]MBB5020034.1 pimeloyl-ACP methyl ester carboxylesterase [Chitinivorax tropicus]